MKTENLDFLAAVRLLVKKGGYIKRKAWEEDCIALDASMNLVCCHGNYAGFWKLLSADNVLGTDWEHVCED